MACCYWAGVAWRALQLMNSSVSVWACRCCLMLLGALWCGLARLGVAWLAMAWSCVVSLGLRCLSMVLVHLSAMFWMWRAAVWRSVVWLGQANRVRASLPRLGPTWSGR